MDNENNNNIKKEVINDESEIHSIDSCLYEVIKSVCKIIYSNEKGTDKGTGFFIKIFFDNGPLFCLMTCEHIITNKLVNNNKTIEIYYDNQKKRIKIELNKNERFIRNFLDLNIDCAIVEILPNDNVSEDYFLLANIDYSNNYENLKKEKIFIPQFPQGGNLSYSKGIIDNIKGYEFSYNASTLPGASGSPIFLIETTYVIGIHKGGDKIKKINYGDFIFPIINLLKNEKIRKKNNNNNNKINQKDIICKNKINNKYESNKKDEKDEINKKIEINKKNESNRKDEINKKNEIKIIITNNINFFSLFSTEFIKNNNDKCEVIINGKNGFKLNNFSEFYYVDESKNKEEKKYEIVLKEIKQITDFGFMFDPLYCDIIQIDFSKWDVSNVTNMKYMFQNCDNISGISKWKVSNVKDMSYMFWGCKNIPDISEWDVSYVKDMSYMFSKCKNIPDISKWNVSNVTNMSYMFNECECKIIPDISNWDVSNVKEMNCMFSECECINICDISKWNISNLTNITGMFYNCVYLTSLPDISNWDISNVKDISNIFDECKSLKSLPDISKWNTSNIVDMSYMFHNCWSLNSFSNISNWKIFNVKNMSHMFHNCWSLKNIPGIEKWDISNVSDMSFMFHNCPIDFNEMKKWNISNFQNSYQMFSNFNNYDLDNMFTVIFRVNMNKFNINSVITLYINADMLVEDVIDKFLKKINKINIIFNSRKIEYIYNAKVLNRNLSAIESGLVNNSNIFVNFR